jgi:hypothetical protein
LHARIPLGVPNRFEALHAALALTNRSMRVLSPVVAHTSCVMRYRWHYIVLRCSVATLLIGHNVARHVPMTLEQHSKEPLRGSRIPALLRQNVEHFTALIDRAPEVDELAVDLAEDLIQVPGVSGATPLAPKPAGILCSKGQTPRPDGLVRDIHASLEHRLLKIAKAQAETKVGPHTAGNDLAREAIAAVDRTR